MINFNPKIILIFFAGCLFSDTFFLFWKSLKAQYKDDSARLESFSKFNNSKDEFSNISLDFDRNSYIFLNQIKNDFINSQSRFFGILGTSEEIAYQIESLDIESNTQSQDGDIFTAEGNVKMRLKNSLLFADKIIYDKVKKSFYAEGNITFIEVKIIWKLKILI